VVVGAHRAGAVAALALQFDQPPVADLFERTQLDPPPRGIQGAGEVVGARSCRTEQIEQVDAALLEVGAKLDQPVLVAAGHQFTSVACNRRRSVRPRVRVVVGGHRRDVVRVERTHIDVTGDRVTPTQITCLDHQDRFVAEGLPQMVQFATQVGQRLLVAGVGPEHPGDPLPRLRHAGVRDKKGDQPESARRARAHQAGAVPYHLLAEQRDLQHRATSATQR